MAPTVKENEIQTSGLETARRSAATPAPPADSSIKQQPVALEVPVSVNGARTVEGSDKREPFSEATKTVLVFGSGAVIRLSSSVAPGQLLFLTNERTKKEVVCQVVKSKNYRNVSGYVELEFTESVVGFWGMRFPSDRIGSGPRPASVSSLPASGSPIAPRPVAPIVAAPAINAPSAVLPTRVAPGPVAKNLELKLSESKFVTPSAPVAPISSAPIVEDFVEQKPVAPVAKLSSSLSTSFDPGGPLNRPVAPPSVPVAPAAPVSATPEFTVNATPVIPSARPSVDFDSPRASESQASFLEPAKTPAGASTSSVPSLLSLFESKPAAAPVATAPPAPVFADPETEALKQQTARLQEQLANMQFSGAPAAPETISVKLPHVAPVAIQKELAESAAKILEMSVIQTPEPMEPAAVEAAKLEEAKVEPAIVEPVKLDSAPVKTLLDDDQLKIPSWLEPLARNAAAPSSTQELIEREKAKRLAEQPRVEEILEESVASAEEDHIPELPMPTFGNALPIDEVRNIGERRSKSSGKGMLYAAIAAGVLVVAGGGWWYMQQPSGTHRGAASNVQASVASLPEVSSPSQAQRNTPPQIDPPAQTKPSTITNTSSESISPANSPNVVPEAASVAPAHNPLPSSNPSNGGANLKTTALIQPVAAPEKKTILGEVHLAAPKVTPNRKAQNGVEADAGIALTNDDQADSSAEALSSGLAGGSGQPAEPAAPVPVGGNVTPAKMISSVPPVYPALAKTQHIAGSVQVDALIDSNGRVTTMKVISGPTLLHQSAMDALKQWKYHPATLNGQPTPMHLMVTIQFRLQ